MPNVDFKTSGFFSKYVVFMWILVFIAAIPLAIVNLPIGLSLLFIGVVVFTTHYRLGIDFDKKEYHDYLWILGYRNGAKEKFTNLEYIFVKKSTESTTMQLRVASSTIQKEVFDGYLKFSESNKIHLLTMDSKEGLIVKLKAMAQQLNVRIIDFSEGSPREL
jgi:hypothetical protein